MVNCSRCHRNIPERDLAEHMASHKGKTFTSSLARPPKNSRVQGPAARQRPGPESAFNKRMIARPQKSNLSQKEVEDIFRQIISELGLKVASLEVVKVAEAVQAQVTFNEGKDVKLEYNDYWLRTLDQDEVRSVLSHEACHIAVLPYSTYYIARGSESAIHWQTTFIDVYDEFLAHEEFVRRYKGSTVMAAYTRVKTSEIANYDGILATCRTGAMPSEFGLFMILNDSVFFPVLGLSEFSQWCIKNGLDNAVLYLDWLIADCKHIENLQLDRKAAMERVVLAGGLWMEVDSNALMKTNKIVFLPLASDYEKFVSGADPTLAESWRKRRLGRV